MMNTKDILTMVNPTTITGRTYIIKTDEESLATVILVARKNYRH